MTYDTIHTNHGKVFGCPLILPGVPRLPRTWYRPAAGGVR